MIICADIETNGLDPDTIHVVCIQQYPSGVKETFTDMKEFIEWVESNKITKWVFHNGLNFDVPVINKLLKEDLIDPLNVIDTSVVSKLVNYTKFNTHSLKELGEFLGVYKGDYTGSWDYLNLDMITYCEQDVEVLMAILKHYWKYIVDPQWAESMRLEHDMAIVCHDMQQTGFSFNTEEAKELLSDIEDELKEIDDSLSEFYGKRLEEVKRLKLKYTKSGELFKALQDNKDKHPKSYIDGDEMVFEDYRVFNPNSSQDCIDLLWDAGWKPIEKTKGHIKKLKENR